MNNMRPERCEFVLLYVCKRHNTLMQKGHADYLGPFPNKSKKAWKRASVPYSCTKKAKKTQKKVTRTHELGRDVQASLCVACGQVSKYHCKCA